VTGFCLEKRFFAPGFALDASWQGAVWLSIIETAVCVFIEKSNLKLAF
jgi:hypothetical protein